MQENPYESPQIPGEQSPQPRLRFGIDWKSWGLNVLLLIVIAAIVVAMFLPSRVR